MHTEGTVNFCHWFAPQSQSISSKSQKEGGLGLYFSISINFKIFFIYSHEDGTVKFWNVTGLSFCLIYTITLSKLFQSDMDDFGPPPDDEDGEDEDWPPFKKVGNFDPFADDPRFVIQKLLLCPVTRVLLVGGSGGQVLIYNLEASNRDTTEVS